ncbi:MAG: RidA family protein [Spirochaetales bacterium]
MDTKVVMTSDAPAAVGPYSQAVVAGGLIFVSGQLPIDPATGAFPSEDIKELTRQSMKNLSAILKKAGTSMDKVVKTTIYLKNLADFAAVNEVYASFFNGSYPARSCFEVAALPKGAKVEIEAIAAL